VTSLEIGSQQLVIPYTDADIDTLLPVAIRAEDIIISLAPDLPISARNILQGTIQKLDVVGERTLVSIHVEAHPLLVKITHEARAHLNLQVGSAVYCVIKANAINLLWR